MSELVHSKLYRRNRELEAEISTLKLELQGWQTAAAEYDLPAVSSTASALIVKANSAPQGMY